MHSVYSRLSNYSGVLFNTTTLLLMTIAIITHFSWRPIPEAKLVIVNYFDVNRNTSTIMFNPGVDLSSQFSSPNLKQIFLYLNVKYGENMENCEMVWSKIITRNAHKVYKSNLRNNYKIGYKLGNRVVFELRANFFPYVGVITDKKLAMVEKTIP